MDVSTVKKPPVAVTKPQPTQRYTEPAAHPLKQAEKPSTEQQAHKTPQPGPVPIVNTQGQHIGRVLNASA